jgi:DNA-binding transcriptional LysR family regulator
VTSSFAVDREMLVASPVLLSRLGTPRNPADLKSMPSAAGQHPPDHGGRYVWRLSGPNEARQSVQHFPRLLTEDLWVIRESALAACTVAALPPVICQDAIDAGQLVRVLPNWMLGEQKLQVTYPSRRGLTLAARTLIDFISSHLRTQLRGLQEVTIQLGTTPYRKKDRVAPGAQSGPHVVTPRVS